MSRKYLLKPDKPDDRDFYSTVNLALKLPSMFDLRPKMPPVFDQEDLGSCGPNAGVAAKMVLSNVTTLLSRLDLYYETRAIMGTAAEDSGVSLRELCIALNKYGVCEEQYFPYNTDTFTIPPSREASDNAKLYTINSYKKVDGLSQLKQYLVSHQLPVIIGMDVYTGMETEEIAKTGKLTMPKRHEQVLGGHAVLVVGYQNQSALSRFLPWKKTDKGCLIVRNSWGPNWGDKGYFYMPYEYLPYVTSMWTIG